MSEFERVEGVDCGYLHSFEERTSSVMHFKLLPAADNRFEFVVGQQRLTQSRINNISSFKSTMLLSRSVGMAVGSSRPTLLLPHAAVIQRNCRCSAKRGRPAKTSEVVSEDGTEPEPAPAKRKGRKRKTEVEPAPTAAEAPLTVQMQPLAVRPATILRAGCSCRCLSAPATGSTACSTQWKG